MITSNRQSLFKNTILYFVNALLTAVLGICINKIFSLFIDPTEYGAYSIVFGIFSLVVSVVYVVFANSILRFYNEYKSSGELTVFYASNLKILLVVGTIFVAAAIVCIPLILFFIDNVIYSTLIVLFFALFIPELLKQMSTSFARCQDKANRQLIANITEHIVKLIVFLLLFFTIQHNVFSVVYGSIVGAIAGVLLFYDCWQFPKKIRNIDTKNTTIKILKFGLPLIGVPIVNYLLSTSDQLIISLFHGEYDTGLYSMGYKLSSSIFSLISSFLITASHHKIMEKYDNSGKVIAEQFLKDNSLLYWLICCPCLIVVFFFRDNIIRILASETYIDSSFVLAFSSLGIVFCGFIPYVNKAWEVGKHSGQIMLFSGMGAILNVCLNFIFIPIYGYKVAAITTIISYLFVIVLSLVFGKKILSPLLPSLHVFKLAICSLLMVIVILVAKSLFDVNSFAFFVITAVISFTIYFSVAFLLLHKDIKRIIAIFKKE